MGLAGMPGVWSRLMRLLFGSFDFVVVYLDDLCIFSRTEPEDVAHLAAVCDVLRLRKLYARFSKSVNFLGHTVSAEGLHVDERKTRAIEQWPVPLSAKSLQSFLGLCGYYRRFICRFADFVLPLSELLKKDLA
ncbi:Polyprotein [Phytophthora palmivora]|uniref:Polyprotein n=1 Tax=Phytophthora palmivora TaxID=4796 RepID=A0A2P4XZ87_9STRA|nr:Polyprotein [Phytophthora palmivora]